MEALNKIKEFIGDGGMVAFEHGFKKPAFEKGGYIHYCTMISDDVAYCVKRYGDGTRRRANFKLTSLPARTLNKLYNSLIEYEEYCRTEA